jgi:glycosyltransferase involved in cell wall biosynthesis
MHVLVLPSWYRTPEHPWGGIFFEHQAAALARAGARVGLAFVEGRSLRLLSPARLAESHFQASCSVERGVTVLRTRGWNTLGQTVAGARLWAALSRRLVGVYARRFGVPDVIHAHAALWAGTVAVRTARELSRPCVVTEHSSLVLRGSLGERERREAGRVYRQADAVFAVSRALLASVRAMAGGEVGRVVPNGVDFEFFALPPAPRAASPFTFLSASNLVAGKRVDLVVRAFATISRERADARLVIVGDGPEEAGLRRLAQERGVASRVEFTGGLAPQGVLERMWRANALVTASAFETFGVVLVEALATGLPVIATRCGGPEDIVEDGLGLLLDRNDEEGLAAAMASVAGRPYSAERLRARAMARFSLDEIAAELLRVYSTLAVKASCGS